MVQCARGYGGEGEKQDDEERSAPKERSGARGRKREREERRDASGTDGDGAPLLYSAVSPRLGGHSRRCAARRESRVTYHLIKREPQYRALVGRHGTRRGARRANREISRAAATAGGGGVARERRRRGAFSQFASLRSLVRARGARVRHCER